MGNNFLKRQVLWLDCLLLRLRSAITCVMSDSENETTVLGKRERDEQNVAPAADASMHDDEQSDEDVGPMPIPSDANGPTVKKKRKGEYHVYSCSGYIPEPTFS